jgi:hypothetical protein
VAARRRKQDDTIAQTQDVISNAVSGFTDLLAPNPRRKGWKDLSPNYRSRLERGGLTAELYRRGASLIKARGHEKTPERPEQAVNNPAKYVDYQRRGGKTMLVLVRDEGVRPVEHLTVRERSTVGKHWNAVKRYVERGDDSTLAKFEGRTVNGVELETNPDEIDDIAIRHGMDFEKVYPSVVAS